jgi:DNA-binding protein YbaB
VTEISDWSDLETQLQETKQQLAEVEQRFLQVRDDSSAKQDLLNQQAQIGEQIQELQIQENLGDRPKNNSKIRRKPSSSNGRSPSHQQKEELAKQLQQLSDRLEQIEADLESRLLSWSSFREPFWQIVRFGGIGVIIGVILRSCAN